MKPTLKNITWDISESLEMHVCSFIVMVIFVDSTPLLTSQIQRYRDNETNVEKIPESMLIITDLTVLDFYKMVPINFCW